MAVSWKLMRSTLAITMCVGLLAACGDRGQFKSKTWTPEQQKLNKAALDAKNGVKTDPADPNQGQVTPRPLNGGQPVDQQQQQQQQQQPPPGQQPPPVQPAPGQQPPPGQTPPAPVDPKKNTGSAKEKIFAELATNAETFISDNKKMLAAQDSAAAAEVFKGLSASARLEGGKVLVTLDAEVKLGNDVRRLSVTDGEVAFNKDGRTNELGATLFEDANEDASTVEGERKVVAACSSANCDEIHVRLAVAGQSDWVELAAILKSPSQGQWVLAGSSIKDLKDFEGQVDLFKPRDPSKLINKDKQAAEKAKAEAEAKAKTEAEKAKTDAEAKAKAEAEAKAKEKEQKSTEQKPAEQKPAAQQPATQQPAAQQPAAQQPAAQQPAAQQPTAQQPAAQQPAAQQPAAQQPAAPAVTKPLPPNPITPKTQAQPDIPVVKSTTLDLMNTKQAISTTIGAQPGLVLNGPSSSKSVVALKTPTPDIFKDTTALANNAVNAPAPAATATTAPTSLTVKNTTLDLAAAKPVVSTTVGAQPAPFVMNSPSTSQSVVAVKQGASTPAAAPAVTTVQKPLSDNNGGPSKTPATDEDAADALAGQIAPL